MIVCENLHKQYGQQVVLSDFSCCFAHAGFYLLYGESGSGKTTLINILSGMIPFEGGKISVNGQAFTACVDWPDESLSFDYITQDSFFADFLTVFENLELISDDKEKIAAVLSQFGLSNVAAQSPATLSGGERQRLSIARACLSQKKILFLDEPTASLDEANKTAVFELLNILKKDILIICSSHDAIAKNYADEILPFHKCTETREAVTEAPAAGIKRSSKKKKIASRPFGRYLLKWFTSKRRSRGGELKFCLFLTLAILLMLLGDLPAHKKDMTYEHTYRLNALVLDVYSKDGPDYATLSNMETVKKVVLSYGGSTPDGIDYDSVDPDGALPPPPYETSLYALPFEKEFFRLIHKIEYGGYFTEDNQVLLSFDDAEKLSPGDHGVLIGSTITKKIYSLGEVEFEIVGILGELNAFEQKYMASLGMDDHSMYFNSKLTDRFIDDENYYMGDEQRTYHLYFDSYLDLSAFLDKYYDPLSEVRGHLYIGAGATHGPTNETIIMLGTVLFPLSIFMAIFTVLFYSTLLKTEITYNNRFIAVFEYAGCPKEKVLSAFAAIHVLRLLIMALISFSVAFGIAEAVNIANRNMVFIGFQLFTLNPPVMVIFLLSAILLAWISITVSLRRLKISSWYENLIRQRDLL